MRYKDELHQWMVNNLEEPFLEAELTRAELAKDDNTIMQEIKQFKKYLYGSLVLLAVPLAAFLFNRF